jgi:signal transduction histidine kinase
LDSDVSEAIHFIQTGVVRLSTIIDALLHLSRVGRIEYQMYHVDVHAIVRRVVESMRSTIQEQQATVSVDSLPPVWGDAAALEQVFANLIDNALNYLSPQRPGEIQVGCLEEACAASGKSCRTFFVKDNGLGIPGAHQQKVFQAFQRIHPDVGKGEGLGLAIVRRVVERHGGRVWLESALGNGTIFYVSLPTAPFNQVAQNLHQAAEEQEEHLLCQQAP